MKLGFVVNPIAGMGGRVGLKGTDGKVAEALERGGVPRSPDRARRTLERLADAGTPIDLYTAAGPMGEDSAREAGFEPTIVYEPASVEEVRVTPGTDSAEGTPEHDQTVPIGTDAEDTIETIEAFVERAVDLVLFVGGDGTAGDIAEALEGTDVPMLGVPAGVKVYSSVFAVSPEDAATIAVSFDRTERREVMDIDEDDYREGEVQPELRAVASVPIAEDLQSSKQLGGGTVESLVEGVAEDVEPGVTYVLAPGSTLGAVKEAIGFEGSPIGVDVWRDGELLVEDASEADILEALGEQNTIVVSPIGGQGFVFGRGNPQLSPAVIRQCDVEIVASRAKLDDLRALRVDTDDPELDEELRGWWRVRVGRFERRMMKVV